MKTIKATTNGRITIPKKLRVKYQIKPGTKVYFYEKDGKIIIVPHNKYMLKAMFGILKGKGNLLKALMEEKKVERG